MAYVSGSFSSILDEVESGITYWLYYTADPISTLLGPGYVADATSKRVTLGDVVDVFTGPLTNFASATGGSALGAVTFAPTVGMTSRFTSQPTFLRCIVSAINAATGAATLSVVELPPVSFTSNPRNILDGADATINPWQRGTGFTGIVATNTYTADRWFMVAGASSSATMTKTAQTGVPGFSQAFVFGRGQSSGSVSTIFLGQVLESLDSIRAQGQMVTFSFYGASNTGFAAGVSGSNITVSVVQGFGTDQSASAMVNNTWTSQSTVVSALVALTTTYNATTRFALSGTVSTTATQLGVLFQYTPTATTATTAENVIMDGAQLEIGGLTPFEHREIEQELAYCQRYFFQANEPATGVFVAMGEVGPTNSGVFILPLPVQMRAAPTVTVTQGSFGASVFGGYVAVTTFTAGTTHTVNYISVNGLLTAVSGQAIQLVGGSANQGKITASADL